MRIRRSYGAPASAARTSSATTGITSRRMPAQVVVEPELSQVRPVHAQSGERLGRVPRHHALPAVPQATDVVNEQHGHALIRTSVTTRAAEP